nr:hypothetical protein [Tanacetum cinerariifolium]
GESKNGDNGIGGNVSDEEEVPDTVFETMGTIVKKREEAESFSSGHFKKSEMPRSGRSILNVLEEMVKVGHVMGYKMDGCMN